MRKIFTLIFALACVSLSMNANAQCTPNTAQTAFLAPDTTTDFALAFTYTPYEQIMTIAVPSDTTFLSFPTTIDSAVFNGITGLPASITYQLNPADSSIMGGEFGCIRFFGTPVISEIGNYPLVINFLVTGKIAGIMDTTLNVPMPGYMIKVLDSASYGIYHPDTRFNFSVYQNTPNPFTDHTEIAFLSPGNEKISVEVFNVAGQMVFSRALVSVQGYNAVLFDGSQYPSGMYLFNVSNGELTVSKRMSLSRN